MDVRLKKNSIKMKTVAGIPFNRRDVRQTDLFIFIGVEYYLFKIFEVVIFLPGKLVPLVCGDRFNWLCKMTSLLSVVRPRMTG